MSVSRWRPADGPTERLGATPSVPAPPSKGVVVAVLLAMLAMLVAIGAALVSWRALNSQPTPATTVSTARSGDLGR
ncbi:hypothetical protein [Actinoplanes sp. TFC3]|uniref:hypothetical protein n=1 Tax=Actinoplanes sp. TFC3 TaxID=1710355 RepID=UPI0012902787|nr:hypothetical protein [Actinoplanes sp. TFC3]